MVDSNIDVRLGPTAILKSPDIPLPSDGSVDVTDEEWHAIEPVLLPKGSQYRFSTHNPRWLLDGIPRKTRTRNGMALNTI